MMTIAAILMLMPLAFAIGQGSEMQQPLATAIISGLVVQFPPCFMCDADPLRPDPAPWGQSRMEGSQGLGLSHARYAMIGTQRIEKGSMGGSP